MSAASFSEDQEESGSASVSVWGGSRGLFNSSLWKALTFRLVFSKYLEQRATSYQHLCACMYVCVCMCAHISSTSLADPGPLSGWWFSQSSNPGTLPLPLYSRSPGSAGTTAVFPAAHVTTNHIFVLVQQQFNISMCMQAWVQLWIIHKTWALWHLKADIKHFTREPQFSAS